MSDGSWLWWFGFGQARQQRNRGLEFVQGLSAARATGEVSLDKLVVARTQRLLQEVREPRLYLFTFDPVFGHHTPRLL
ncbi:MAG TPA: hypothetical protein VFO52_14340 [Longimicrobiales bacterium]|nr:hypothetical protein [Longimicrobiales bacterium]